MVPIEMSNDYPVTFPFYGGISMSHFRMSSFMDFVLWFPLAVLAGVDGDISLEMA
jgi:hypothetical protein